MKHKAKKSFCFFLLVFLLSAFSPSAWAADGVPPPVLAAKNGVVRIYVSDGQNTFTGTGFAVSSDANGTVIVTNHHVAAAGGAYTLYYDGYGPVPLSLLAASPAQDLCLLHTARPVPGLTPLRLCTAGVKTGQAVFALGYPQGADILSADAALSKSSMTVTDGIISAVQSSRAVGTGETPVQLIQTNTAVNHGSSGGPLLSVKGEVVGVTALGLADFHMQGLNGAVHIAELLSFLDSYGVPYQTAFSALPGVLCGFLSLAAALSLALLFRFKKKRPFYVGPRQAAFLSLPFGRRASFAPSVSPAFSSASPVPVSFKAKKFRPAPFCAVFILAAAAAVFVWHSFGVYSRIKSAVNCQNYTQVLTLYEKAPWLETFIDGRPKLYSQAMCAVQAGNFDTALALFQSVKDYRDSRHQARCIPLYERMLQTDDPFLKCSLCIELGDFLDTPQYYAQALPALYRSYVKAVETGRFSMAETYSACLPEIYENVAGYEALRALGPPQSAEETHAFLTVCEQYRIPAQPFFQSTLIQMDNFLKGDWVSSSGYYFSCDGRYFYTNIFRAASAYFLSDGVGIDQDGHADVLIDYQSPNDILLRYQNRDYLLRRK